MLVKSFIGCFPLITGTMVVGILWVITSMLRITTSLVKAYYPDIIETEVPNTYAVDVFLLRESVYASKYIFIKTSIILIASIWMIAGTIKERGRWMVAFLIFVVVDMIDFNFSILYACIFYFKFDIMIYVFFVVPYYLLTMFCGSYSLLVVYSRMRELPEALLFKQQNYG